MAPWNRFKPSCKIFLLCEWPFQGGTSFADHLCYLWLVFVMLSRLFIATLWSPDGKGPISWFLFLMFNCVFVNFPCGILGQVCYLIVSVPDLCRLSYFESIWCWYLLKAYWLDNPNKYHNKLIRKISINIINNVLRLKKVKYNSVFHTWSLWCTRMLCGKQSKCWPWSADRSKLIYIYTSKQFISGFIILILKEFIHVRCLRLS